MHESRRHYHEFLTGGTGIQVCDSCGAEPRPDELNESMDDVAVGKPLFTGWYIACAR
jgi:hypothetical protein